MNEMNEMNEMNGMNGMIGMNEMNGMNGMNEMVFILFVAAMEEDERRDGGQETIEESLARVRRQIVDTSERLRTRVEEMTAKHGRIIQTKREAESLLSQSPSFGSARRSNGEPLLPSHSEPNGSDVRSSLPHCASFVLPLSVSLLSSHHQWRQQKQPKRQTRRLPPTRRPGQTNLLPLSAQKCKRSRKD